MKIVYTEEGALVYSNNAAAMETALDNLLKKDNILRNENIPNEEQVINEQDHILNNQEDDEFYQNESEDEPEEGIQNDENFDTDGAQRND